MNPRYFVVLGVIGLLSPSQTTAQRRSVQIRHLHMANPTMTTALGGAALAATPSLDVVPWKPAGISSNQFESHAAFDPRTGDLYFVRSSPQFTGWRILVSHCTAP